MKISLLGYMGSGKSTVGKLLAQQLQLPFFDLDEEIEKKLGESISIFFKNNGEIEFRKVEKEILEDLLNSKNDMVLALGGGTPVYYNNMQLLNEKSKTFYLQNNVNTLAERLRKEKDRRPLIAHLENEALEEFISKHLFERNPFYSMAQHTINGNDNSEAELVDKIIPHLHRPPHQ